MTLKDLLSCSHPIEQVDQCAGHNMLQVCIRCGARRWLGGPQPAWQRPWLVEEAATQAAAAVKLEGGHEGS
jgi:hypothetical protein